jgi:hypothetical protein
MGTMPKTVLTNRTLCRAFLIASLLTGDAAQSESAVSSVIASSDPEEISEEEFISRAATAALAAPPRGCVRGSPKVPAGLTNVLRLPQSHRRCFVLRTLAAISREECSRILNLDVRTVDESTALAAAELAEFPLRGASRGGYASGDTNRKSYELPPPTFLPSPAVSELNNRG